jgi:hypothetical protein
MYQTNYHVPFITFYPFINRFYIFWSLRFGQVHIFNLPLLQTWSNYLNYSYSTLMPLVKRFSLKGQWSSVYYSTFLSILLPQTIILLFVITSNYFVVTRSHYLLCKNNNLTKHFSKCNQSIIIWYELWCFWHLKSPICYGNLKSIHEIHTMWLYRI